DVKSASGARHWDSFDTTSGALGATLVGRTHSGLVAALASHVGFVNVPEHAAPEVKGDLGASWAAELCRVPMRVAERRELYRTVTLFTSRDAVQPWQGLDTTWPHATYARPRAAAEDLRVELARKPIAPLLERHEAAWRERWRRANVTIDGAPGI